VTIDLFTEEHEALRASVRSFVDKELIPNVEEWERNELFPKEIFTRAGALGLFGMKFPEDIGGSGPDLVADAVVTEEFARCGSGGVAACLGAHKDLAALYVYNFGSSDQHERWLRPALDGSIVGALGVTEPDTGSDVAAIKTRAERSNGEWVLNGSKMFITNGSWADFVVVAAKTGPPRRDVEADKTDPEGGHDGITLFVVERDMQGFSSRRMPMLGWRTGQTGELHFDDVRVPDSHRLGEVGAGFRAIMQNFAWERLIMALGQVAGGQRVYDLAKAYVLDRPAFGRPIGKFQVWRHRFADMATRLEAGRAMTYNALRLLAQGEYPVKEVAMAKLYTSELAFHIADECVQAHGGLGYMMEFPAQRALRDSRLGPIGGGTSEIMKEIIGRTMGL
jgi:acyl-CoA dehydrogenase